MKAVYRSAGGESHEVIVEARGPLCAHVESGSVAGEFTLVPIGPGRFRMTNGERSWRVCVDRAGAVRHVTVEGEGEARFEREAPGRRRRREASEGSHASPMPGTVVKVLVSVGDGVDRGQDLLVVEAMKMEIKVSAQVGGILIEHYGFKTPMLITVGLYLISSMLSLFFFHDFERKVLIPKREAEAAEAS